MKEARIALLAERAAREAAVTKLLPGCRKFQTFALLKVFCSESDPTASTVYAVEPTVRAAREAAVTTPTPYPHALNPKP